MQRCTAMQITQLFMDLVLNSVPLRFLDAKIKRSELHADASLGLFRNSVNRLKIQEKGKLQKSI